ncbi:MAG: hypothetical protein MN733_36550, partial [Nitrososphaera sp.]|nr:hypothetical protein [Nitrososphaera sp.]
WDWLVWWLLRRLFRPRGFPRRLVLAELIGALCSPIFYKAAQVRARKIASRFSTKQEELRGQVPMNSHPKPEV